MGKLDAVFRHRDEVNSVRNPIEPAALDGASYRLVLWTGSTNLDPGQRGSLGSQANCRSVSHKLNQSASCVGSPEQYALADCLPGVGRRDASSQIYAAL